MNASAERTVILVHGAWHGAWCWATLQAELDRRGVASFAIDLPGHGTSPLAPGDLIADVAETHRVLDAVAGSVVLVGHSYGGAVVAAAAAGREDVDTTVFLAAYALSAGESITTVLSDHPGDDAALRSAIVMGDDGTSTLDPEHAPAALYGSCPPDAIRAALPRLGPQSMANFAQEIPESVIGTAAPTVYVRCLLDAAVPVAQQDAMASRCSRTVTLDTDHSPFLSETLAVADLLTELAGAGS